MGAEHQERNDRIIQLASAGMQAPEIAARFDLSATRIAQIAGIGRGRISRPDHRERNADIVEQVKAGISPSDVAVRFGLSVKRICQIAGVGRGRAAPSGSPGAQQGDPRPHSRWRIASRRGADVRSFREANFPDHRSARGPLLVPQEKSKWSTLVTMPAAS